MAGCRGRVRAGVSGHLNSMRAYGTRRGTEGAQEYTGQQKADAGRGHPEKV